VLKLLLTGTIINYIYAQLSSTVVKAVRWLYVLETDKSMFCNFCSFCALVTKIQQTVVFEICCYNLQALLNCSAFC